MLKISDLLIMTYGNQSEVARMLLVDRAIVRKYMKLNDAHFVVKNDDVYSLFTRVGG